MFNEASVTFRPARASDAGALPLILSSGPDSFNYVFRTARVSPKQFLAYAFAQGGGEFGHLNHVVGELDGLVGAGGAGGAADRSLAFTLAAVGQFWRVFGPLGTPPVIVRGLQTETIVRPPAAGEFCIGHLGVDPGYRGRGIGEALIRHLLALGAARGLPRAVLDVAVTNPRAEALYARLGFRVTAERTSRYRRALGFVPSHRRMERALGAMLDLSSI